MKSFLPLACLLLVATSRAEEPLAPQEPSKSMVVAYALAAGATLTPILLAGVPKTEDDVVGWTLLGLGGVLGPSMGQFYAASPVSAWAGTAIRAAGFAIAVSTVASLGDVSGVILAGAFMATGMIYSLGDTKGAVDRANARHVSLAPALLPRRDGRLAPGLAFNATF